MNKNIASAFENKKAFIGFVTAGDPDLDTSRQILLEMAKNGCDLIEVGIAAVAAVLPEQEGADRW